MNYIAEVSDLFLQRRGTTLGLSPLDWQIISDWEKQEIPLKIILRSMNEVFDRLQQSNKKTKIKSLEYFQEAIEENYENWLQTQVGKAF